MKRYLSMILVLAIIFSVSSCGKVDSREDDEDTVITGTTVYTMDDGDDIYLELDCDDGKHYAIVANRNETGLVWLDNTAFEYWEGTNTDPWDMLDYGMRLNVTAGEQTESRNKELDACVEAWYMAKDITVIKIDESIFAYDAKPVIYLYPKERSEVEVELDYSGKLTCTYPKYENGWSITAEPDGTLYDSKGQEYSYLYWEGISSAKYDFSKGACIPGKDTAQYLEYALGAQGLTRREANEFIVYWLPLMEKNDYNLISFQTEAYANNAKLKITPEPDTVIRVFMAWKKIVTPQVITPQIFETPERTGFTVVEWGGCEIK